MATASGTVVPYVFSDYSQWERKHPSCQNNKSSNKSGLSFVGKKKRQKSSQEGTTNEAEIRPRLLQMQISQRRHSIAVKQTQAQSLERCNRDIISLIQNNDAHTSGVVSTALKRYHRFKGCLQMVEEQSKKALTTAHSQLTEVIETKHKEIEDLQTLVDLCSKQLKKQSKQLQTLLGYKDKEYPLKLVQIEQLRAQLEYLGERHQREVSELESLLEEEKVKYDQVMETTRLKLEDKATKYHLNLMDDSTIALGLHNKLMEKELMVHEKRLYHVKRDISILKDKIRVTKTLIAENPPHQLKISSLGRCAPDTELVLDIPVVNNQEKFMT